MEQQYRSDVLSLYSKQKGVGPVTELSSLEVWLLDRLVEANKDIIQQMEYEKLIEDEIYESMYHELVQQQMADEARLMMQYRNEYD